MTGTTTPDGLPYPNDYTKPADSPNAFQALATATQAALTAKAAGVDTEAAYVKSPTGVVVGDWNAATLAGFYYAAGNAANQPATSQGGALWMGFVTHHTPAWVHQLVWPVGEGPYPWAAASQRAMVNGVWQPWQRLNGYDYSWGTLDNMTYIEHVAAGHVYRRFSHGMSKDTANGYGTALDEWRVQCYDAEGVFTWSAIKIPESGVVTMPRGHATLRERIASGEPIPADTVLTVGALAEILRAGVGPGELNVGPPSEEVPDGDH